LRGCKQINGDVSNFTGLSATLQESKQIYGDVRNFTGTYAIVRVYGDVSNLQGCKKLYTEM